jgi:cystathionine beta-lyase
MTDSVYQPVRTFCDRFLKRFGVETTYYDPLAGAGIAALIRPNTRVVYLESPGSLTFEVQDVPAIAEAAHAAGALVIFDNTWATPLCCKPLRLGADVVVHAATKYLVGHSDAMLGVVVASAALWRKIKLNGHGMGFAAAPDDCYLALRGLRTLSVRLRRHEASALALARWLALRPEVERLLHPALPGDPGHALWKRDFTGACGLFGVVLKPCPEPALAAMLDGLKLFGMGFSWGGYESLILPAKPAQLRTATQWEAAGPTLRIHAGLEDPQDLIADLEAGFARLALAREAA